MSLIDLINRKKECNTDTDIYTKYNNIHYVNNISGIKNKNLDIATATVATLATHKPATDSIQLEMVRAWLSKIGEPEEDHFIVLEKCKSDPEALAYFLKHASGEF